MSGSCKPTWAGLLVLKWEPSRNCYIKGQLLSSTTVLPDYDQSKPPARFRCTYRHLLIRLYNLTCKVLPKQLPVFQGQDPVTSRATMGQLESSKVHGWTQNQVKSYLRQHSKGTGYNSSWMCISCSCTSGRFLNYFNLGTYLEYLYIHQGDSISNFHHVNQRPPISPIKKNSDTNYANWQSTHIDGDVNNRSSLPLYYTFLIRVQKHLVRT